MADEPGRELLLQIQARTRALRGGRSHDPLLVHVVGADVIAGLIVSTLDRQVLLTRRRAVEDVVLIVEPIDGESILVERIEIEGLLFPKLALGEARRRRVMRLTDSSALREDLNDAIVCARAVQRGRGRAARHLDVLDVVGVEIGKPVLRIGPRAEIGELRRSVVDDHPVDDVEGVGAGDERVHTAEAYRDSAASWTAGVLRDLRARHLPLHRLIDRNGLGPPNERRVDGGDARSDGALLGRGAGARDDDLTEVHGADVEDDGTEVIVAGVDGDRLFDWLIADAPRLDGARSCRNGEEGEFTLLSGEDADAGPGDGDLCLGNSSSGDAIGDVTADGAGRGLGGKARRICQDEWNGERKQQRAASEGAGGHAGAPVAGEHGRRDCHDRSWPVGRKNSVGCGV